MNVKQCLTKQVQCNICKSSKNYFNVGKGVPFRHRECQVWCSILLKNLVSTCLGYALHMSRLFYMSVSKFLILRSIELSSYRDVLFLPNPSIVMYPKGKSCYNPLRLVTVIVLISSGIDFVSTLQI